MRAALKWRRTFEVDRILQANPDNDKDYYKALERENKDGKLYIRGYDKEGRALLYMKPVNESTHDEDYNLRFLVYSLEKAIACTQRESVKRGSKYPLCKINLVIDYNGFRLSDAPPMSTSQKTLEILQKSYPECLFRAYVVDPPWIFKTFWALIKPFVDVNTRAKLVFCTGKNHELLQRADKSQLEVFCGGSDTKKFDSTGYMSLPMDKAFGEEI
jgi:CRAL/TRIO domain